MTVTIVSIAASAAADRPDTSGGQDGLAASRREARRRAFLDAAGVLFAENGYGATSLADVVKRSGGSLATLYEFFGSKAGLFKALIADRAGRLSRVLDQPEAADRPVAESLEAYGRQMLDLLLDPGVIAVQRLVIAESAHFPELASSYFSAGPAAVMRDLRAYIARQAERGRLSVEDAGLAAEHFGGLVKGMSHVCALFGVATGLSDEDRALRVHEAVRAFLKIYAACPR